MITKFQLYEKIIKNQSKHPLEDSKKMNDLVDIIMNGEHHIWTKHDNKVKLGIIRIILEFPIDRVVDILFDRKRVISTLNGDLKINELKELILSVFNFELYQKRIDFNL